jgi:hypothetical protein
MQEAKRKGCFGHLLHVGSRFPPSRSRVGKVPKYGFQMQPELDALQQPQALNQRRQTTLP